LEIVDCLVWIPAFAGMTANGNTGMILPGPVIPAKAGIQSQYKSCKNLLEFAIIVLFPIMSIEMQKILCTVYYSPLQWSRAENDGKLMIDKEMEFQ
jgi:hypothetical protein